MLPVFFFLVPPFDAEFFELFVENFLNFLWRIFGEEFLGKNCWGRIFGEEPLQEQAPNSDFFDLGVKFCIKQGGMLPVFFWGVFPPFDAEFFEFVENFLWRILWEEFLGKNFGEEPLQEQAPNSDFFDFGVNFCLKQGGKCCPFFFSCFHPSMLNF